MLKKLSAIILGLILVTVGVLAVWYQIDGIPVEETGDYLQGEGYTATEDDAGNLLFRPDAGNGHGIVIMHGALIKPLSYARSAAFFAQHGYTVYLPYGPGRMSIAAVDSVPGDLARLEVDEWFFIGHSMGGMASLQTISSSNIDTQAVALWATAMPQDFSELDLPMLFIWGDADGLLPAERFREGQANLPDDVRYITLEGANHKNFAMYSHQFFDGDASLDWMEQIDFANETTVAFFDSHL